MNDTKRLYFLEKKVFTVLTFDNATKLWWMGTKEQSMIFAKKDIRDLIDAACDYSLPLVGLEKYVTGDRDSLRIDFLNKAFFNRVYWDGDRNLWNIGDKHSNIDVSSALRLREAIDRLIGKNV